MLSRSVTPQTIETGRLTLQPDAAMRRIGLLLLATDLRTEIDAARLLAAPNVAVHSTRVAFDNPTTPDNLRQMEPRLADASRLLVPGTDLHAIYYACTSASAVIGDDAIDRTIAEAHPDVPVVTPTRAALDAFRVLGARRIALVTPYVEETAIPMIAYFGRFGIEVTTAVCFGFEDDRVMARITPESLLETAAGVDLASADAVFVSCTALPSVDIAASLEQRVGLPVVTANQAALWALRGHAGITGDPGGAGSLFAHPPG